MRRHGVAEGAATGCSVGLCWADASIFALPEATLVAPARGRSHGSWHQAYPITSCSGAMAGWRDFPLGGVSKEEIQRIRRHEKAGRPLGNDGFVGKLEETLGRILQRQKPERKRGHKQKQVYCPLITRLAPGSQLPLEGHALFERELNP